MPAVLPAAARLRFRTAAGGSRSGPAYWPRLLPVLVLLVALTRVPSFRRPVWNPDEGFLATQARMLIDGGRLYDTVVDRKPPLLPRLYQLSFEVFGDATLVPVKVAAVLAVVSTAALVASIARRRWGDGAGWTAGVGYALVSIGLNPEDAQAASFELFMLPFTVLAVWCAERRRWGPAGLAVALAALTKQTGAAVLLPVLVLLWHGVPPGRRRGPAAALVLGTVLPVAAAALAHGPGRFLFWTVTGSGSYLSLTGSELHVLSRALLNAAILGTACAGLIAPVVGVLRRGRGAAVLGPELWVWLAASALAVVTGFHFFGHYYLQLLPPLVLLGTGALQLLPSRRLWAALGCCALTATLFLGWAVLAGSSSLEHARRVADAVRQHTGRSQTVLVWGMHPEVYWLSGRPPASRFLTAGFLTNFSGGRDGPRVGQQYAVQGSWRLFLAELHHRPPAVIVDDSRGKPYRPARTPLLRGFLNRYYTKAGTADGAVIYLRGD